MNRRVIFALCAASTVATSTTNAQQVDRTKPPTLPLPKSLVLPPARTAKLANGMHLYVVEMHEVPVVQFALAIAGGGLQDKTRPGLAAFTANMLDEGADTLDAFGIAAQAEYLGATLSTSADWDKIDISLKVPKRTLTPGLRLMADVALRPTFKSAEIARQRDLRLAEILQQRDVPQAVASLAFNATVFPKNHPYHYSLGGDSATIARVDSATVRAFYQRMFRPNRATIIVTGDITLAEAQRAVEQAFGSWKVGPCSGEACATLAGTPLPMPRARASAVHLVDKPGAAQSVIRIGTPGVNRHNPDYYAIEVMNTILGGSFSSRLNTNLRETKGYSYGANSRFLYRPVPGPFVAAASVRSDVTDSSLIEFAKELHRIRDSAVSSTELNRAKAYLTLGLAGDFETSSQMASQIGSLLTFGLPLDYFNTYAAHIDRVTAADVQRVARTYIRPDSATIVIVGDVAKIRPGIDALRLGPSAIRPAP